MCNRPCRENRCLAGAEGNVLLGVRPKTSDYPKGFKFLIERALPETTSIQGISDVRLSLYCACVAT